MKAGKYLEKENIVFEEVVQDNPTKSCDDAAKERGLKTCQIVKSLIIESGGEKYHVCLPGDRTLSESKFGEEYRLVPPQESKSITGFESGTVHPFSTKLKHVIDERIFENQNVSHTVGEKKRGVILDSSDFRKALNKSDFEFEIRDIAVSNKEDFKELEEKGLDEETAKFVVEKGYRKLFLNIHQKHDNDWVTDLLEEVNRNEMDINEDEAEKVLERAEDQTHIQRLVNHLSENGELPDKQEFDLREKVSKVISDNPEALEDLRNGQDSAVNFLIGQLMQETNGKADAGKAEELIKKQVE
jgi:prolyl-tRNA editing enzyme YbaK/EbsC (Cys-tRNA(Pro) deacylase)